MRAAAFRVLVLWVLNAGSAGEAPAADACYTVMHVSPCGGDGAVEVSQVLQIAGAADLFCVTVVGFVDFIAGSPQALSDFDAILFGIHDGGLDPARVSELRDYVAQGGGIVWTHDTLDCGGSGGPDIEEPAGVATGAAGIWSAEVQVARDHDILHVPFEIGSVGETFSVLDTHTNGGQVTTAEIILQFVGAAAPNNFFLTTHEHEDGRVAFLETGHSGYACAGVPSVSQKEAEIVANTLFWAASGSAVDCNQNGVSDSRDIRGGTSPDCNHNRVPDECDISQGAVKDCNENGVPDECDLGVELGFIPEEEIPLNDKPVAVVAGDFSGDGRTDLAYASAGSKSIAALIRLESGELFPEPPVELPSAPTFLAAAHLNGDGHLDLVASTKGSLDNVHVFLGRGDCFFLPPTPHTIGKGARCIAVADLDADGDEDVVVAAEDDSQVFFLWNGGDATFSSTFISLDGKPSWVSTGDLTGDRIPDLAVLLRDVGTLMVLRNVGGGNFEPGAMVRVGGVTSLGRCVAAGDWDGDGDLDLAVALEGDSSLALLAGSGDGTFAAPEAMPLGDPPVFVAARDLDFDADLDLVAASSSAGSVTVLRNAGGFNKMPPLPAGKGSCFVAMVDLVGSVALDLIVANQDADAARVLRNTCSPPIDQDCNLNGVPDSCDIAGGVLADADGDKVPDSCEGAAASFLRSDANSDGKTDISDAISTLAYLFTGGGAPACLEAADINDDGAVNITDPIFLLIYLFGGGLRPADPFGACGADPTEDSLACGSFPPCV